MEQNILANNALRRKIILGLVALTVVLTGVVGVSYFQRLNLALPLSTQAKTLNSGEVSATSTAVPNAGSTSLATSNLKEADPSKTSLGGLVPHLELTIKEITYADFLAYLRTSPVLKSAITEECRQSAQFCAKRMIVRVAQQAYFNTFACATPSAVPTGTTAPPTNPTSSGTCTYLDVALKTDDGRLLPIGTVVDDKAHLNADYVEGLAFLPVSGFGVLGIGNLSDLKTSERFALDTASFYILQLS